jgi:HSP20 family protein
MALTRWDPLRDLLALHEQLRPLVGADAPGWTPPVDLYETSDVFILTAELPGLTRDQVEIEAEESRITIRGTRNNGQLACEQFHRLERGHGRFMRAFILPEPIDIEGVAAELKEGLLTLTMPKAGGRGARRVDVA